MLASFRDVVFFQHVHFFQATEMHVLNACVLHLEVAWIGRVKGNTKVNTCIPSCFLSVGFTVK